MSTENFMIYGKTHKQNREGAFFGFNVEGVPVFGGGNLIDACVFWNTTFKSVESACEKIKERYKDCEASPKKI